MKTGMRGRQTDKKENISWLKSCKVPNSVHCLLIILLKSDKADQERAAITKNTTARYGLSDKMYYLHCFSQPNLRQRHD